VRARLQRHRRGGGSGQEHPPLGQAYAVAAGQSDTLGQRAPGIAEYRGGRADLGDPAVDFEHDAEVLQPGRHRLPRPDDERSRRGVVGDDVRQRKLEVRVPRVDQLDGRGDGPDRSREVPARLRGARHQEGHLGLHPRMDEGSWVNGAAVGHPHPVGEAAPDHLVDTHLGHLRPAGEPHLETHQALAAGHPALDERGLDGVRGVGVQPGLGGELGNRGGLLRRLVQPGGEFLNTGSVPHGAHRTGFR